MIRPVRPYCSLCGGKGLAPACAICGKPPKRPVHSRNKGKRGELEAAKLFTEAGFPAERAQQFKGKAGAFDLNCPTLEARGFGLEVKNTARPSFPDWIDRAKQDSQKFLIVWHKARDGWYALTPLSVMLDLLKDAPNE